MLSVCVRCTSNQVYVIFPVTYLFSGKILENYGESFLKSGCGFNETHQQECVATDGS